MHEFALSELRGFNRVLEHIFSQNFQIQSGEWIFRLLSWLLRSGFQCHLQMHWGKEIAFQFERRALELFSDAAKTELLSLLVTSNRFHRIGFHELAPGGTFADFHELAPAFGQVSARTVPCNPPSCQSRSDSVLRPLRSPRRMFEPCAVPGSRLWPRLLVGGQTLSAQHLEGRLAPPQRQVVSEASGSPQQRLVRSGLLPQLGLVLLGSLPPLVRLEQPLRPSLLLGA